MYSFTVEILDDEGSKCTLYTVRKDGASKSETEKFFEKRQTTLSKFKREFQELTNFLTQVIANEYGALSDFFREEREADAIPPKRNEEWENIAVYYIDFPLRLYCLRISDDKLILFNGDEKTTWAGQDGKTRNSFNDAQQFAVKIKEAMKEGYLDFKEEETFIY